MMVLLACSLGGMSTCMHALWPKGLPPMGTTVRPQGLFGGGRSSSLFFLSAGLRGHVRDPQAIDPPNHTMLLLSSWLWGLKNDGNERRNQTHVSEQQAPSLYTKPTPNPRPGLISAPLWQPTNQPDVPGACSLKQGCRCHSKRKKVAG